MLNIGCHMCPLLPTAHMTFQAEPSYMWFWLKILWWSIFNMQRFLLSHRISVWQYCKRNFLNKNTSLELRSVEPAFWWPRNMKNCSADLQWKQQLWWWSHYVMIKLDTHTSLMFVSAPTINFYQFPITSFWQLFAHYNWKSNGSTSWRH